MSQMKDLIKISNSLYSNITRLKTSLVKHYDKVSIPKNDLAIDIAIDRVVKDFLEMEDLLMYSKEDYLVFMKEEVGILDDRLLNRNDPKLLHLEYLHIHVAIIRYWEKLGFSGIKSYKIDDKGILHLSLNTTSSLTDQKQVKENGFTIGSSDNMMHNLILSNENLNLLYEKLGIFFKDIIDMDYNIVNGNEAILIDSVNLKANINEVNSDFFKSLNNLVIFKDRVIEYKIKDIENASKQVQDFLTMSKPYLAYEMDISMALLKNMLRILFDDLKSNNKLLATSYDKELNFLLDEIISMENSLTLKALDDEQKNTEAIYMNKLKKWWSGYGFSDDISFYSDSYDEITISLPCTVIQDMHWNFDYVDSRKKHKELKFTENNKNGLIQIITDRLPLANIFDLGIDISHKNIFVIEKIVIKLNYLSNTLS